MSRFEKAFGGSESRCFFVGKGMEDKTITKMNKKSY